MSYFSFMERANGLFVHSILDISYMRGLHYAALQAAALLLLLFFLSFYASSCSFIWNMFFSVFLPLRLHFASFVMVVLLFCWVMVVGYDPKTSIGSFGYLLHDSLTHLVLIFSV